MEFSNQRPCVVVPSEVKVLLQGLRVFKFHRTVEPCVSMSSLYRPQLVVITAACE